jgi:hypothetical protein
MRVHGDPSWALFMCGRNFKRHRVQADALAWLTQSPDLRLLLQGA